MKQMLQFNLCQEQQIDIIFFINVTFFHRIFHKLLIIIIKKICTLTKAMDDIFDIQMFIQIIRLMHVIKLNVKQGEKE